MTLHVLDTVWRHYPDGGSKLIVMLALADYAGRDDGSQIYPSIDKLARKCRMSRRQVIRIVKELIGTPDNPGDFLELETPANQGGRRRSNLYRIRVDRLKSLPDITLETVSNCHWSEGENSDKFSGNRDILTPETVTNSTGNSDTAMTPKPKEPNITQRNRAKAAGAAAAVTWGPPPESRESTLRTYIAHLQSLPERVRPKGELERAQAELDEHLLRGRRA